MNPMRITDWWIVESQRVSNAYKLKIYDAVDDKMLYFESKKQAGEELELDEYTVLGLMSSKFYSLKNRYYRSKKDYEKRPCIKLLDTIDNNVYVFDTAIEVADFIGCSIHSVNNLLSGKQQFIQKRYRVKSE